jgi:opacity protein-like surface antigen
MLSSKNVCNRTASLLIFLFAALAGAVPMGATAAVGDAPEFTMGVGFAAVNPRTSNLGDRSSTGFGASLSWNWAFKRRHALRVALEYASFSGKTFYEYPMEYEGGASTALAALDYICGWVSHDRGLYVGVGTGYGNTSIQPDNMGWYSDTLSGLGFRYSAGVGYNFTKNLGLEVSVMATSTYDASRQAGAELFGWSQASLRYRFSAPGGDR